MGDLSLYVHVPFCRRRCPYCSFYHVRPDRDAQAAFVAALAGEARDVLAGLPQPVTLRTVFFGGGTPSVLGPKAWEEMFAAILPYLPAGPAAAEVTCELNPEDADDAWLDAAAGLGVNRVSLGVQSMDESAQRTLGRCSPSANRRAIERVCRRFDNVSFDVLLGVPGCGGASLARTIDELVGHRPAHFSVYCLEPGGDLDGAGAARFFDGVDAERCADEYLEACARLGGAGYHHYEVSNFALPGRESRHNRVYWDGGDYMGLGPAAHSYVGGRRYHNPASLETYLAARAGGSGRRVEDRLGPAERALERLMLGLRTDRGVAVGALRCPPDTIDVILQEGLGRVENGRLTLTDRGFLLLDEIAMRLSRED